jgi:drug/metabolite transporter (DMT)-like permease
MTSRTATFIGFTAIMMWSLLAMLTAASGRVPPFQLAAMTFAVGGLLGAASWAFRPGAFKALRQPLPVWALGIFGLFGYHALYFMALRLAPPAESGLINYLWPLLIVLFSAFLPGEKLKAHHIFGALLGLIGTIVLVAGRAQIGFAPEFTPAIVPPLSRPSCGRSIRCCRAASRRCRPTRWSAFASSRQFSVRSATWHSSRRSGRKMRDSGLPFSLSASGL